jgi:hypothetical protein
LARVEFAIILALGLGGEQKARTLYRELMSRPEIFTELITILYKPHSAPSREDASDAIKSAANVAWQVLRSCKRMPGADDDGVIDDRRFFGFIEATRSLFRRLDHIRVGADNFEAVARVSDQSTFKIDRDRGRRSLFSMQA